MSKNDSTSRNPRSENAAQREEPNHESIVNCTQNFNELPPKQLVAVAVDESGNKAIFCFQYEQEHKQYAPRATHSGDLIFQKECGLRNLTRQKLGQARVG